MNMSGNVKSFFCYFLHAGDRILVAKFCFDGIDKKLSEIQFWRCYQTADNEATPNIGHLSTGDVLGGCNKSGQESVFFRIS